MLSLPSCHHPELHQLSLELNRGCHWPPNIPYWAYVVKRSSRPRTFVNSCISADPSLLDSVLVDSIFRMIVIIIILHDFFYTQINITVLYHREVIEETSASQVLNRNEMIYSNKIPTVIFLFLLAECSAWVNFLLIPADVVSWVFHWHNCKRGQTKWKKLNKA